MLDLVRCTHEDELGSLKSLVGEAGARARQASDELHRLEEHEKQLEAALERAERSLRMPVIEPAKGGNRLDITCDYKFAREHVFMGECKQDGSDQVVGGHFKHTLKEGMELIGISPPNSLGIYRATIRWNAIKSTDKNSTMFPDHWEKEDVERAFRCAMQAPTGLDRDLRGVCLVNGKLLEIGTLGYNQGKKEVATFFPIFDARV